MTNEELKVMADMICPADVFCNCCGPARKLLEEVERLRRILFIAADELEGEGMKGWANHLRDKISTPRNASNVADSITEESNP